MRQGGRAKREEREQSKYEDVNVARRGGERGVVGDGTNLGETDHRQIGDASARQLREDGMHGCNEESSQQRE